MSTGRSLCDAGPLLLVLDECHDRPEVGGKLRAELLELLPQARDVAGATRGT